MKIVLAPNAFKGSMTAAQAAQALAQGVRAACPTAEIRQLPVADGGDGLTEVLIDALHGEARGFRVQGPRLEPVEAALCHVPTLGLAAVEMAVASGLALLAPEQRDPIRTSSYGTGELIRAALDLGARRIIVGLGGSATSDGGIGMAAALGMRFLDAAGKPVAPIGGALRQIQQIDASGLDPRLAEVRCEAICDVDNPLLGATGAAAVYAPQKGATPAQVAVLEAGLAHLAERIAAEFGVEVGGLPGAGAAGGAAAGLHAFLGAELRRGVDLVLDLVGLDEALAGADLVLTGEGQIDEQTAFGKAPAGVAERAKARGIPCIAIAGSMGQRTECLHAIGIDALFSLCAGPMSLEQAIAQGPSLLAATAEQVLRCYLRGVGASSG